MYGLIIYLLILNPVNSLHVLDVHDDDNTDS